MAFQLLLAKREDFISDINTFSLAGFTAGIDLDEGGWTPAEPTEGDEQLEEMLTLQIKSTTTDGLAVIAQNLREKIKEVGYYKDEAERYGIWLRSQLTGETNARQALILEARQRPVSPLAARQVEAGFFIKQYELGLVRTPWWESLLTQLYDSILGVSCVGGTYDYTTYGGSPGVVVGDTAGRLALIRFDGHDGGGGPLTKFWTGFRSNRFGNRANFQSYWSLRKGAAFDADTTGGTTNADATAKDGYKTITTFATVATLLRRVTIRNSDVTATPIDQRGSYMVLLRAKNSAAGTVRVRLTDGLYSSVGYRIQSRVPISSTSWQFYELGTVNIPSPGKLINTDLAVGSYAMGIDAERISGACSLEMDCLVLIPIGEGYVFVDGANVQYSAPNTNPMFVTQHADGRTASVQNTTEPVSVGTPRVGGGVPTGNGILVLAGQRVSSSVLADHIDMSMSVYPRWSLLRGAE